MPSAHYQETGDLGILALADPLSRLLRALDASYLRGAHARVVHALAVTRHGTRDLRFATFHPGYSAPGRTWSTPFDWTGWASPHLFRVRDSAQDELWQQLAVRLPTDSPRLVGQSCSARARVYDFAPDDFDAALAVIIETASEEPWTVEALREAAAEVDPMEPWWQLACLRDSGDATRFAYAKERAWRAYSDAGFEIIRRDFSRLVP
jgi:hypothetical protein